MNKCAVVSTFVATISVVMITISLISIGTGNYRYIGSRENAVGILVIGYVVLMINAVMCGIYGKCFNTCHNRYDRIQTDENDINKNSDVECDTDENSEDEEVEIRVK